MVGSWILQQGIPCGDSDFLTRSTTTITSCTVEDLQVGLYHNKSICPLFNNYGSVQWEQNGGKCGLCGDPHHAEEPRPHEAGGLFAKGIITRHYRYSYKFDDFIQVLNLIGLQCRPNN